MIKTVLFSEQGHTWYSFSRDPDKSPDVVDTNEYLIVSDGEGMALDPGGTEIFPQVVSALAQVIPIESIKHFLATHQDPDVMSSLPLWMIFAGETWCRMCASGCHWSMVSGSTSQQLAPSVNCSNPRRAKKVRVRINSVSMPMTAWVAR